MFDINNVNIPLMEDEGLIKIMELYSHLYNEGLYTLPLQKYIANSIQLTNDCNPTENDIDEYVSSKNKYCIEIIYSLLKAMREDIETYGLYEYINRIKRQSIKNEILEYMNVSEILSVLNFPQDKIKDCINKGEIDKLPNLLQYLYKSNFFKEEHVGYKEQLPYVIKKDEFTEEYNGQGRKRFRIYINNPVSSSGLDFYLIFVKKLIEERIPYDNKFNYHFKQERKDKSIFYFSTDYINEVTGILDQIYFEHPELISKFGTPPTACAQTSYYGISHMGAGIKVKNRTYNMFIDDVTCFSFFIYYCKQMLMHGAIFSKMTEEEKIIIKKYALGVMDEEIKNEIINTTVPTSSPLIKQIVSKYGNKFKITINPKDYRNILKRVASLKMYGDLEHIEYPICFNENFYDASLKITKKI